MKSKLLVCAIFLVLMLFPLLAFGEPAATNSRTRAPNAANNPLTYVEVVRDMGLEGASSVAVSPDGAHVYATAWLDDALAVYSRDASTGRLTWLEVHKESYANGLNGANSVVVSPDGKHVYVASLSVSAVVVFSRNASSGLLTWEEVHYDVPTDEGLGGARSVTVSPDGAHVYVAGSSDNAVAVFSRDASTGLLTWEEAYKDLDGLGGARSVVVSPDGDHVYVAGYDDNAVAVFSRNASSGLLTWEEWHQDSLTEDGLDGAISVAVSSDGDHVYVAGSFDDAVVVFSRDAVTGRLTWEEMHQDSLAEDGLDGAYSVTVSPDGDHVYVAGRTADAVAVFSRDGTSGLLTWEEVHKDSPSLDGLDGARSVMVSLDGENIYVASEGSQAVAVFNRDGTTGELAFSQALENAPGLEGALGVAVSPDGNHVYATGNDDDSVAIFDRDGATGRLDYSSTESDSPSTDGLNGARAVALDSAGENVYVSGCEDDAVAVFQRYAVTGWLAWLEVQVDGDGADGLDCPQALVVSPDDKHVYVASQGEDAVAIFGRSVITGGLTYAGVVRDNSGPVDGLDGAYALAITADGDYVYVAGYVDDAVTVFQRDDTSGALTFQYVYTDTDATLSGLNGANSLALSPDDNYLYVASRVEDAVAVYQRTPATGALFAVQVMRDGQGGVDGLDGARAVAVSADGSQVYVASQVDDALAVFDRDTVSGQLQYAGMYQDSQNDVDGLNTANGLAVSPEGGHVYVTGYGDDAVAVFARYRVYLPLVIR